MSDVRLPPSNADASAAGIKAGDEIEVSRTFAMLCKVILSVNDSDDDSLSLSSLVASAPRVLHPS